MAVPVQDQVIDQKHLINITFPTFPSAQIERRLTFRLFQNIIVLQRDLSLARLLEILRFTEPGFIILAIYFDQSMDLGIIQVFYPQMAKQPLHNDLVDALMPGDLLEGVKIG